MALVKLTELEFDKNTNSSVFGKLRTELQSTTSVPHECAQRKQEIFRLMRQLQERKRLQQVGFRLAHFQRGPFQAGTMHATAV